MTQVMRTACRESCKIQYAIRKKSISEISLQTHIEVTPTLISEIPDLFPMRVHACKMCSYKNESILHTLFDNF